MQNKKTIPNKIDFSDNLDPHEEKMIELFAGGESKTDAYGKAYKATGYSRAALRVQACRKFAEPHIIKRLNLLQSVGLANASLTRENRIEEELAFAKRAELDGNYGAAGGAYDRINKLMGLYVEKYENVGPEDPLQALKDIAKLSPEIARQLAASENINWPDDEPQARTH